jgi:hypothetical protein
VKGSLHLLLKRDNWPSSGDEASLNLANLYALLKDSSPITMAEPTTSNKGLYGRVRGASLSLMSANPQLGMWQASGLAIAQAPNLNELRDPESGGDKIEFNSQGHSMRTAIEESDGELTLAKSSIRAPTVELPVGTEEEAKGDDHHHRHHHHLNIHDRAHHLMERRRALREKHKAEFREKWGPTMLNALKAFWKFFKTPAGFLITIYF